MKKKALTYFLVLVTAGLLGLVLYVGKILSSAEQPAITTIHKTKASNVTYRDTAQIIADQAAGQATITVTPTKPTQEELSPQPTGFQKQQTNQEKSVDALATGTQNNIGGISPTEESQPEVTLSPTAGDDPTPTEIILAKANISPTSTRSGITVKPTKTTMPESGWTEALPTIIALASVIIFISFLY